ncbi:SDR family NAD(P)-dependent oxidoreductase [Shewanella sp. JM162201]|uniref:SDR family NAD(P)-dependent oxidoreductase n=1 Tax=Shewanella jiangmenensis TaxID=2837387 RepID=A0ABS5V3N2_9GAMM|nr:SDR family NAD(P)-dependent oxidoreductase [Shewanella jiangmenensis]MBT1444437.1 SDR family NAD(P)-dependent oxidoreductase [Shewanella jiangmenensis]
MNADKDMTSPPAVLITGASSGIGRALVGQYLANGWQVYACGRDEGRLDSLAVDFSEHSAKLCRIGFDVNSRDACLRAAGSLSTPIDLAIFNAGTCEYLDSPLGFDGELFARVIETNLISIGYCLEAFLPKLAADGRVALMGSSAALLPLPRAEAYGASKAALAYLADTLRIHLASVGAAISVSLIEPGFVRTPLTDKNDFPMPGRIEVDDAARRIASALDAGKNRIQFPRRLLWPMKLMALLPKPLWATLAKHSVSR